MEGFKSFVRQYDHNILQDLQGLKKAAATVLSWIKRFFLVLETASQVQREVDYYVIRSKEFQQYMMEKFGCKPKLMVGGWGYQNSCGQDGCAYFFSNRVVVKFSYDAREMEIAERVAGLLRRVPIMDAFEIEIQEKGSVLYAIVMRELETGSRMDENYTEAYSIFAAVLDRLMDLVYKKPDIPVEYIRKRLSLAYMTREGGVSRKTRAYLEDLIRAVRAVYIRSGYLLGADWESHNLGMTRSGKVQPYDFGRSYDHPPARAMAAARDRKTLVIPSS